MKNCKFFFFIFCLSLAVNSSAQKILPGITVRNVSGKIIVSWQNAFTTAVSNIFIQRSYDSLKNYYTIGSVLNPQSKENGYADVNPPYTKMYYRVTISFQGGAYMISLPERPVKDLPVTDTANNNNKDKPGEQETLYPWQSKPGADSIVLISPPRKDNEISYPSERIFTSKDNNVIVHLENAATKRYTAKFFNETDSLLFELTKLTDEYLIVEKVNFGHTGWFHFEIYENGKLIEKNKFQILSKEQKPGNK